MALSHILLAVQVIVYLTFYLYVQNFVGFNLKLQKCSFITQWPTWPRQHMVNVECPMSLCKAMGTVYMFQESKHLASLMYLVVHTFIPGAQIYYTAVLTLWPELI